MPAFHPAARPRFACSSTRTSGKSSRTTSTVPSLEPLSTRTVSSPRTLSRHRSIHGSALKVTTTAPASRMSRSGSPPQPLPEQDHDTRKSHGDGDEEEEEAGGERCFRVDPEL